MQDGTLDVLVAKRVYGYQAVRKVPRYSRELSLVIAMIRELGKWGWRTVWGFSEGRVTVKLDKGPHMILVNSASRHQAVVRDEMEELARITSEGVLQALDRDELTQSEILTRAREQRMAARHG